MDSMDLEREKGITIKAKNAAIKWNGYKINIVDTPGHADFGAEVERVMKMVDGVLLLTDAVSGPQAQTRWVLRKALGHGLKTICVVNKIDRDTARPQWVHDKVLELFLELGADDDQFNAPFLYGSAKLGFADHKLDGPRKDMTDLFEAIIERVPPPVVEEALIRLLGQPTTCPHGNPYPGSDYTVTGTRNLAEVPVGTGEVDWDGLFSVMSAKGLEVGMMIEREAGDDRVGDILVARKIRRASCRERV